MPTKKDAPKLFVLILCLLFILVSLSTSAQAAAYVSSEEEGARYKQQGDEYARKGDFTKAAEIYMKALSSNAKFSHDERREMARSIAWGGDLDSARKELGRLLAKNPRDSKARLMLARVLFWSSDIDESYNENERVLSGDPDNRDALLLKGDILRIKGKPQEAISVYQDLLKKGDDFEVRNSLAYAYLAAGNVSEARSNLDLLMPVLSYQRKEVELLMEAIVETEKPRVTVQEDPARQTKSAGDRFAGEENFQRAAEEYSKALKMPNRFTVDERFQMARAMSWGGRLEEARGALNAILLASPEHIAARIQLARVLMWSGELDACLKEINLVLATAPDNGDAYLVKANVLRLKRNLRVAVPLYDRLLKETDDFDVREGLIYAYIANRDRISSDKSIPMLQPSYPYQRKSFSELKDARDGQFNPSLSTGFTFYDDSDENQVWRYLVNGTAWIKNWMLSLGYVHTHAISPDWAKESDDVLLSAYSRMPFYGGIGASVGMANPGGYVIGGIRADIDIPDGSAGVNISTNLLRDTAQLIDNRIRIKTSSFTIFYRPTDRIDLLGSYSYNAYSDRNYSHIMNVNVPFKLIRQPVTLSVGYRFRYMDFEKHTRNGYFDPFNFFSNAGFINLSFDQPRFYGFFEPYGGYQTYSRYDQSHNESFIGGSCLFGYRLTKNLAIELTGEGSNGGVGASSAGEGFNYYQVGFGIKYTF